MSGNFLSLKGPQRALAFLLTLALLVGTLGFAGMAAEPVYAEEPEEAGVYYVSATGTADYTLNFDGYEMEVDALIIPTWYKVYVVDPAEPHVTVRIEGNGYGTDGTNNNIEEVIDSTVVHLSDLGDAPTALDALNEALQMNGITEKVEDGLITEIGGVYAMPGSNASWLLMHNDESVSDSVGNTMISAGDNIVICLSVFDDTWKSTTDYRYFRVINHSSDIKNGYAYGEVTLVLYNKKDMGWGEEGTIWEVTKVDGAAIYTNGIQAYTPDGTPAVTDSLNGAATITLWGGDSAGTYYFDIRSSATEVTNAYCRATMIYDGENEPTIILSQPSTADTSLRTMDAFFNEGGRTNALPYVNGDGITVNHEVETVIVEATAVDGGAEVTASYKAADDNDFSPYDLGEYKKVNLDLGNNIFRITVTNGTDVQIHSLIITRENENVRDIPGEVEEVIEGVKNVKGYQPVTDWILAMNEAGFIVSEGDKIEYLAAVLPSINDFADSRTGNVGTMAKIAVALTSLGIDVRQIPDPDGGDAPIDMIDLIANYSGSMNINSAPYVLSLYDLESSSGEKIYPIRHDPEWTREDLINVILTAQNLSTGMYGSVDDTGPALCALAPYYLEEEDNLNGIEVQAIKTAVSTAVNALSDAQSIDGGFGARNSNTTSMAIIGLAALGIDPNKDPFKKSGSTLIINLLSFRTNDNKLGFTNNVFANEYASVQGFQALAAYQNLTGQRSSNIYHFPAEVSVYTNWPDAKLLTGIAVTTNPTKTTYDLNEGEGSSTTVNTAGMEVTAYYNGDISDSKVIEEGYTVSTIDTTIPGTKSVTVTYQGHTATFNVTVKGSGGSIPEEETVKITVKSSGKGTIASDSAYVIEPGKTTVMDVLKAVLSKAGKPHVIHGGIYVSEIDGLGEFTGGENSGWLYYVDGEDPKKSAADCKLYGGEVIEWIYTLDFTKEKGSEQWNQLVLTEETTGTIAKDALDAVLKDINAGKADNWTVSLALGDIAFDKEALAGLVDQMSGDSVEITIEQASNKDLSVKQREAAGDRPVYNINVTSGKKNISEFGGKLTISLPYKLKEGESPLGIVVYYLDNEGNLIPLEGAYDPVAGKVVFTVDHLSYFVIGYDETLAKWPFTDVTENDWFYTPVKYAYERGIFSGTGAATFAPNSPLTRSMLVAVLARMSGADLSAYKEVSFNDVDINSWYGPSVAWAKEMGVVSGYANKDGSFSFKPDDKISRQDIAVMLNNYNEKVAKKTYGQKAAKLIFTDHQQIAGYAKAAVESMQQAGIISGMKNQDGSFRFQPLSNATRAEAATMIYNMLVEKN
jgi:hypothetical protein